MDTELLRLKIKKYLAQYEYLSNEYDETQYLFEKYKKEFYKDCPKKVIINDVNDSEELKNNANANANNKNKNESQNESQNEPPLDSVESINHTQIYISKIISKLYKKLCLKTHPDKDKENIYKAKFETISNAYNKKDFLKLLLLSRELNLNTDNIYKDENEETPNKNEETLNPEIEETYTSLFEKSINDMNDKIKGIKSTLAWNWALSNPEQKQHLRERFLF